MLSETADNVTWGRFASQQAHAQHAGKDAPSTTPLASALGRIEFLHLVTPKPLHAIIEKTAELSESVRVARLVSVVGRSRRLAVEDHHGELKEVMGAYGAVRGEVRRTVGDVATALVVARRGAGIVVMQAAGVALD
jgi:hypothetical protein